MSARPTGVNKGIGDCRQFLGVYCRAQRNTPVRSSAIRGSLLWESTWRFAIQTNPAMLGWNTQGESPVCEVNPPG